MDRPIETRPSETSRGARRRAFGLAALACAMAAPATGRALEFDRPVEVQRITANDGRETICSHFPDLTLVERRDGPTAETPVILDDPHARCDAGLAGQGRALDLSGMSFDGRVGMMLFFSQMDPHGAVEFALVEALDRKVVFRDAAVGEPLILTAEVGHSAFEVTYLRGVNASCSLLADARRCWSQLIGEGKVPADMASVGPRGTICTRSYAEAKAPADAPSVVTWSSGVHVFPDGEIRRTALHDFGCLPQP